MAILEVALFGRALLWTQQQVSCSSTLAAQTSTSETLENTSTSTCASLRGGGDGVLFRPGRTFFSTSSKALLCTAYLHFTQLLRYTSKIEKASDNMSTLLNYRRLLHLLLYTCHCGETPRKLRHAFVKLGSPHSAYWEIRIVSHCLY